MAIEVCSLSVLLLLASSMLLAASVRGQSSSGFLSIDCGKRNNYTDSSTELPYVTDSGYVDAGEVHEVPEELKNMGHYVHAYDLRSFPNGTRNCYTLPAQMGNKYLLRAFFMYGNYDGLNQIPKFDLYVGTNFWTTINIRNSSINYYTEVIVMAPASSISVCLVNTDDGVPFISALELRPWKDHLYPPVNSSQSLVSFFRLNFAATKELRYPIDVYDRKWTPFTKAGWTNIRTTSKVGMNDDSFETPPEVMGTAATPTNGSSLNVSFATGQSQRFFFAMHFAELQQLAENQTRLFNISINGEDRVERFSPTYLSPFAFYNGRPNTYKDSITISVYEATGSALPPIINAMEVYEVREMTNLATYSGDVDAIMEIRGLYQVKRNWMGDPCAPKSFIWHGLNCSYDDSSNKSRIISLNLSSFGLTGGIPLVLANLIQLESLDLSSNSLNGSIPDFLSELQHLKLLDLSGNELSGKIPKALQERSTSGALKLSVANNQELCTNYPDLCGKRESNNSSKTIIIVVPIVVVVVLILIALVLVILRKALKSSTTNTKRDKKQASIGASLNLQSFHSDSRSFTYAELETITKNFNRPIGKGGFGVVYHGIQKNGTQVAVKVPSQSSSQGAKEFQNEAQLLTRIHHKNLVPLVGYCNDNNHMALVYEYMAGGSLQGHLSGEARKSMTLSWSNRLRIAVESAQGLEYLHKGCNPAIVHRDVKTSNILLTDRLEARVSDFGLSKTFQNDAITPMSTIVMGTPGYLDPEYHNSNKLNEKSDVYSFGVVLLEIVTGLPAIINVVGNTTIIKWVETRVARGVISEIVDPSLQGEYDTNSAWKVVELALACTSSMSIQRPTMTEVLMLLKECVEIELHDARRHESRSTNQSDGISIEVLPIQMSTITSPLAR